MSRNHQPQSCAPGCASLASDEEGARTPPRGDRMRRRDFTIGLALAATARSGRAQEPAKQHRIAIITPARPEGFADLAREVVYRKPDAIVAITSPSRERSTRRPAQYRSFGPLYRFEAPTLPFPPGARLSGESVTTGCS